MMKLIIENNRSRIYTILPNYIQYYQARPDTFLGNGFDSMKAAGGNIMGHTSTYRIFLRRAGHNRITTMLDSPYHAYSQVKFTIGEEGIQDLEKKDSRALAVGLQ
jgi:DNA repair protein RadA